LAGEVRALGRPPCKHDGPGSASHRSRAGWSRIPNPQTLRDACIASRPDPYGPQYPAFTPSSSVSPRIEPIRSMGPDRRWPGLELLAVSQREISGHSPAVDEAFPILSSWGISVGDHPWTSAKHSSISLASRRRRRSPRFHIARTSGSSASSSLAAVFTPGYTSIGPKRPMWDTAQAAQGRFAWKSLRTGPTGGSSRPRKAAAACRNRVFGRPPLEAIGPFAYYPPPPIRRRRPLGGEW
jgi:hypothetical protein